MKNALLPWVNLWISLDLDLAGNIWDNVCTKLKRTKVVVVLDKLMQNFYVSNLKTKRTHCDQIQVDR